MSLPETCSIAFKEWAAVCEALAAGRQTIVLRKGGIHEGREGFRVQHPQFWLYPTHFHQAAESLTADANIFIDRAHRGIHALVPLRLLASVETVHELTSEAAVLNLTGMHIWSEATVRQRLHYKRPGLFLLVTQVYSMPSPILVAESAEMAGCKSWVTLPDGLPTAGLLPVLSAQQFDEQVAAVERAVARAAAGLYS